MSINSRCGRTETAVRAGIAARLDEIQARTDATSDGHWETRLEETQYGHISNVVGLAEEGQDGSSLNFLPIISTNSTSADAEFIAHARTDVPALANAVESVLDYVDRCEESGITMQPGDVRRLVAAALGGAS